MKTSCFFIVCVCLSIIGFAERLLYAGDKKGPIEVAWAVTDLKSKWVPVSPSEGKTEIKWKNLVAKPIQIIEFEIVYEHKLSGLAKTLKYTDVLTAPAEPKKYVKSN